MKRTLGIVALGGCLAIMSALLLSGGVSASASGKEACARSLSACSSKGNCPSCPSCPTPCGPCPGPCKTCGHCAKETPGLAL